LIQDQALVRNVDSENLAIRFDCFKFLFHSFSAETFATQSARSGHGAMASSLSAFGAKRT